MQLLGSIIAAIAVIAVTIAVVTSQLGPFKEDTERQEQIQEQQENNRSSRRSNVRILRTVVTTTVTTLALAVDASAASVKVDADCSVRYYCSWHVTYTAAPGERNDVTVTSGDGYVDIRDAGAPIAGCTASEPQTVRCTTAHGEFARVDIALGDGDDLARGSANFDGGEGQDTITGGGRIDGGPGRDHLSSVAGALFADGDLEPDRFDGSLAGRDGLDFTGREAGVRVDLRRGRTAEGDLFTSVEDVIGSLHDDVLIGTDGPNQLVGHAGADRLVGLKGNDQLFSYIEGWNDGSVADREVLEGGPGDDELTVGLRSRAGTVSRCGPASTSWTSWGATG